ncbi:CBP80/20-dependent translation initiation factor-like isoform X2 [Saccostrea echinata]|uniref:CBP80/20-dependent translation initiation factor-like isoform X2 n=1 Tax=Saccostrea echinata TaxID=191078 RepID=UPI002A82DDAC|nr:CBP80/20-dependent translation initiation factor-like isoform X2 [Saccostrea echinata]
MASVGRGRGRGRGLLVTKVGSAPKPGPEGDVGSTKNGESPPAGGTVQELEDYLEGLTLNLTEDNLEDILTLSKSMSTEDHVMNVAKRIYDKSLKDLEFAKCGACICDRLSNVEVQTAKFRNVILRYVQEDFKGKEEMRSSDNKRYLGFVTFLCQVFGNVRLTTGDTMKPLVAPVFECLEQILQDQTSTEDEYECLSLQLQCIGKDLELQDQPRMSALLDQVRTRIIKDGLIARGRCTLLELLECGSRGWKPLYNDLTRLYCDTVVEIFATRIE